MPENPKKEPQNPTSNIWLKLVIKIRFPIYTYFGRIQCARGVLIDGSLRIYSLINTAKFSFSASVHKNCEEPTGASHLNTVSSSPSSFFTRLGKGLLISMDLFENSVISFLGFCFSAVR